MRSQFIEAFVDQIAKEGLGVTQACLSDVISLVDRVIAEHDQELQDTVTFEQTKADFGRLTERMIAEARRQGYADLHEDTLYAAREQCGLIFWCA